MWHDFCNLHSFYKNQFRLAVLNLFLNYYGLSSAITIALYGAIQASFAKKVTCHLDMARIPRFLDKTLFTIAFYSSSASAFS